MAPCGWVLAQGRVFSSGEGKSRFPVRAVGAFLDITDRKQVEEAMTRSVSLLRATLESTADGILVVDLEGRIVEFNQRFAEMWNMTPDLLAEGKGQDLLVSSRDERMMRFVLNQLKDPRGFLAKVSELYTQPEASSFDILEFKDGRTFERYSLPQYIAGQPVGRVWSFRDVSDRKQAEQALAASEARYRLIVETIPHLAWRTSPDGIQIECNRRWHEYTGQAPDRIQAHGWLAAVHPDDLFRVVEKAAHAVSSHEPYEIEYRLRRASDGSYRWHLVRGEPIFDHNGAVTCWVGTCTDIEELRQAQEILKLAHDEELQEIQAELAHVAHLGMMGEMTASIAHELNQPLYAIKNYAYGSICRLRATPAQDEELIEVLEKINNEAGRAAEIIHRTRVFLQKRASRSVDVPLARLIEEAVFLTRMEIQHFRTKVVVEPTRNLPAIVGDPVQIEQVIINLLRNALEAMDHTPDDNRRLHIRLVWHDEENIGVEVRDAGKGINEADREKLFEPFFTTKPEGLGMGLAISRSIIQAHGGRLWVTANQDQGCTFHFTLPISKGGRKQ